MSAILFSSFRFTADAFLCYDVFIVFSYGCAYMSRSHIICNRQQHVLKTAFRSSTLIMR